VAVERSAVGVSVDYSELFLGINCRYCAAARRGAVTADHAMDLHE